MTLMFAPAKIRLLAVCWLSFVPVACSGPPARPPKLVEAIDVTDFEGHPLPEVLKAHPAEPVELLLALTPAAIDASQFPTRPAKPPEEWRFKPEVRMESGEFAPPVGFLMIEEFYDFNTLATQSGGAEGKTIWISPARPPAAFGDRITRWGMVRAPQEPGRYEISIVAYPTASQRGGNVEVWGDGLAMWSKILEVTPAPADHTVVIPDRMSIGERQNSPSEATLRRQLNQKK